MPIRTDSIGPNFVWGEVTTTEQGAATTERLWKKLTGNVALMKNARGLAIVLQLFRTKFGRTTVTSWYRDLILNTLVRGDARSGHLTAAAVDFRLTVPNNSTHETAWEWMQATLRAHTSQMIAYRRDDGTIIRFHMALSFGGGRLAEVKEKRAGVYTTIARAATFPIRDPDAPVLAARLPVAGTRAAETVGKAQEAASTAIGALRAFLQADGGNGVLPAPAVVLFAVLLLLIAGRALGGAN